MEVKGATALIEEKVTDYINLLLMIILLAILLLFLNLTLCLVPKGVLELQHP